MSIETSSEMASPSRKRARKSFILLDSDSNDDKIASSRDQSPLPVADFTLDSGFMDNDFELGEMQNHLELNVNAVSQDSDASFHLGSDEESPPAKSPTKKPKEPEAKKSRPSAAKPREWLSDVPVVLPSRSVDNTVLMQGNHPSLNVTTDVGSIGRLTVEPTHIKLDLKGQFYKGYTMPSNTFMILNMRPNEAKVEAVCDSVVKLHYESKMSDFSHVVGRAPSVLKTRAKPKKKRKKKQ